MIIVLLSLDPRGGWSNRIGEVCRHHQSRAGQNRDGKDPKVPADHERDKIVEGQFGPLIKSAFIRHQAIEEDHGDRERNVERDDREDPEYALLVT